MNARENNNLASEVITDLTKNLVLMDNKIQGLYGEICEVKSMFQAVHYATVEGGITQVEADEALTAIKTMLENLKDNAEEITGFSNGLVKEVM